ncbi:hypothetical protein [Breoghania sp.]|uniref:hypothetical protein n=1 Tax=Breoghania sp. TaxID=2065378 RepID=UPI002AA74D63|nr:hypothetical protein [Breoghania sp.]
MSSGETTAAPAIAKLRLRFPVTDSRKNFVPFPDPDPLPEKQVCLYGSKGA